MFDRVFRGVATTRDLWSSPTAAVDFLRTAGLLYRGPLGPLPTPPYYMRQVWGRLWAVRGGIFKNAADANHQQQPIGRK